MRKANADATHHSFVLVPLVAPFAQLYRTSCQTLAAARDAAVAKFLATLAFDATVRLANSCRHLAPLHLGRGTKGDNGDLKTGEGHRFIVKFSVNPNETSDVRKCHQVSQAS